MSINIHLVSLIKKELRNLRSVLYYIIYLGL
jgi:hypothetical protein